VTYRLPPRSAEWLLERLGSGSRFDSLIGDLAEQFAGGRSRIWYWQQTTGVLGLKVLGDLRAHALSFTAAVLAGCCVTSLWVRAMSYVFRPIYANLSHFGRHPWSGEALLRVAGMQLNGISSGVLTFGTVWLVTRVHRAHQRAALAAFVTLLTAPSLPEIARLIGDAVTHSHIPNGLVPIFVPTCLQAAITLVAGLWMIRTRCFAGLDRRTRIAGILVAAGSSSAAVLFDSRRVAVVFAELDRRTRFAAILAAVLATFVALIYRARLVGALPQIRPEWFLLDVLDIASVSYLAYLLWKPGMASPNAGHPEIATHGPPSMRS
jgi:hypothetical protein